MICKVQKTIERFAMLENARSVAVGLSGGADSVCLFDILLKLKGKYGFEIVAVHINHNLRGAEAMRDQRFVEKLCKKNQIKLKIVSYDVAKIAKEKHIGVEECGRMVRYQAFEGANCDKIAVAHNLSDCIETTLFNLIRGSSLSGICRIPPTRGNVIRPLIDCSAAEIRQYCRENNLEYVVDSTNLHDDYSRNFIRQSIVPLFSRVNENYEESFKRFYDSASLDEAYLKETAKKALESAKTKNGFNRSILLSFDNAVYYRCIRSMLENVMKKQVEKRHVDLVCKVIEKTGCVQLSKDLYIFVNRDIIAFRSHQKKAEPWISKPNGNAFVSPYKTYELSFEAFDKKGYAGDNNICDASFISNSSFMRSKKEGDSITFFKRNVTKTLKKLFNEEKIPAEKRNEIGVLDSGGKIIWVEGFGVNAPYRVSDKTQRIAIIKIKEG